MIGQEFYFNNEKFIVEKLLGKGKSGYSYLISNENKSLVLKKIHHEPCEYYNFGNKLMAEVWAYKKLKETGINIPELFYYHEQEEYLVKEYIHGETAAYMASEGVLEEEHFEQAFSLAKKLYDHNINVDFFPTNFIFEKNNLYMIDYECNQYIEEWDFETWGIYFWLNKDGMKEHLEKGSSPKLCLPGSAKPVQDPFVEKAKYLINKYSKKI